jgi:hypothetical protein
MPSTSTPATPFIERRESTPSSHTTGAVATRERRQFSNSHDHLSPEAGELAVAIDQYKLQHRRRFINFEEMLSIMKSLGYHK